MLKAALTEMRVEFRDERTASAAIVQAEQFDEIEHPRQIMSDVCGEPRVQCALMRRL